MDAGGPADPLASIDPRLCVACKAARGLCGIDPCPLLRRVQHHLPASQKVGRDVAGSSPPSLFVGRYGYPKVNVGPMLPPDHRAADAADLLDAPRRWLDLSIPDVVGLRSSLIRTTHAVKVDQGARDPDRITRLSQELAVAARPVDTEVQLTKAPSFDTSHVGEFTAPHGPTVGVERAVATENVRVERPVERVTGDTDLRASEGAWELYRGGTDRYQLERILSAGMLGLGARRRLVPTRWAITASDDTIGKQLAQQVQDLPTIDKPTVHTGGAFGNHFQILLLPRIWSYEFQEVWLKGAFWAAGAAEPIAAADHEDHRGRTGYARATAGAYYATRLSVLEHLVAAGRQATAIVLREVTDDYTTPLGVWVVREAARLSLESRGLPFETTDDALRHMDRHARYKGWQAHMELLRRLRTQPSLDRWA
ncbi:MAG: hypothetical protein ACPGQL_04370 [Thermoplasmatota archaeon]